MTGRLGAVVIAVAGAAALVGNLIDQPLLAVLGGVAIGTVAAAIARASLDTGLRRLHAQLTQWGRGGARATVVLTGGRAWRELGAELNRIGAQYDMSRGRGPEQLLWREDLVSSLVSGAVLFDEGGHLVASNARGRELLGLPDHLTHATVLQALGSVPLAEAVGQAASGHEGVQLETEIGGRQLRARVSQVGTDVLITLNDRSWERRVDEVRRHFVVNASHELKTPATAIQALAEALQITTERDPQRVPELVGRLQGEADRLVRLVHDLLDLRRLEEVSTVTRVEVDLAGVVRRCVGELHERARSREVQLEVVAPDHATLQIDHEDVELIVRNLVSNAIQYNRPGGRVTVTLEHFGARDATPWQSAATDPPPTARACWQLVVTDTGIGIPSQDLPRIFERFYRVDVARSRQSGGTGLGLSLVRHAVERNHGAIAVESLLGAGSTFSVTLPELD